MALYQKNSLGKYATKIIGGVRYYVKALTSAVRCCCNGFLYQQARLCPGPGGALQDVWMTTADAAGFPGAFTVNNGAICYYFAGDGGNSPGTLYTAGQAQGTTDCASCPACWNGLCDGTTSYQLDMTGNWNITTGCGGTDRSTTTSPDAPQIYTLLFNGACTYVYFGNPNLATLDTLTPGDMSILADAPQLEVFNDGTGTLLCPHFRWRVFMQFVTTDSLGNTVVYDAYYWGPRTPNGAGTYYLSLASDPYPSDACLVGNIPATVVVS